jgi:hypothetical protein
VEPPGSESGDIEHTWGMYNKPIGCSTPAYGAPHKQTKPSEIYAIVKKPTITETIRLHRLRWFGHVQRMEENRIPKRVLCMNLESTRPRGRPRNRWQDEVREDGRIVGGEEWQEEVYNREDWKELLRTARNCRVLHMTMELMN